jgi:hypothetical protein
MGNDTARLRRHREDQSGYIILFPVSLLCRATSVLITLTSYYEIRRVTSYPIAGFLWLEVLFTQAPSLCGLGWYRDSKAQVYFQFTEPTQSEPGPQQIPSLG